MARDYARRIREESGGRPRALQTARGLSQEALAHEAGPEDRS